MLYFFFIWAGENKDNAKKETKPINQIKQWELLLYDMIHMVLQNIAKIFKYQLANKKLVTFSLNKCL